jgi:hypothetical protein
MSKVRIFEKFRKFITENNPEDFENALSIYAGGPLSSRKLLKRLRPKRYKRAFSMGYRGFPKQTTRLGSIPAPTQDQVRATERKYGRRIHVKNGLMYFKTEGSYGAPISI